MRDIEREADTQAEGKQAPCREPDVGLDPGTPGSRLGPKAGAKPLSHPGIPLSQEILSKKDVQTFLEKPVETQDRDWEVDPTPVSQYSPAWGPGRRQ